jgi:flagellar biosynthesis protein FlhF
MDVHLIVEATTSEADLVDIAARYSALPLTSLVISKLDEANNFGNVYNLMQTTRLPFSYFTVGQNVPEDIELATPERVADLLLDVTAYA